MSFDRLNHRWLSLVLLVAVVGCGGNAPKPQQQAEPAGDVVLAAACPGAHVAYDNLVASNPASQTVFVDQLHELWVAADADARDALDPVIAAAKALEAAGRGPNFSTAQDGVYQSIVGLDADCREVGALILH